MMKRKILSVFLCLMAAVFLCCSSALSEAVQEQQTTLLDAAFHGEQLTLTKVPLSIAPCDYEIGVPVATYKDYETILDFSTDYMSTDGKTAFDSAVHSEVSSILLNSFPIGVSPDGKTELFFNGRFAFAFREKQMIYMLPIKREDLEDRDNAFKLFVQDSRFGLPCEEGVHWSSDGRYIIMGHFYEYAQVAKTTNLFLMDTYTGEIYQLTNYGTEKLGDRGNILNVGFSPSSQTLFYTTITHGPDGYFALKQYDIQKDEHKICFTGSRKECYQDRPALAVFPDRFVLELFTSIPKKSNQDGIVLYTPASDFWERTVMKFPYSSELLRGYDLHYSADSSFVVVRGMTEQGRKLFLVRIDTNSNFAGIDTVWSIEDFDDKYASVIAEKELEAIQNGSYSVEYCKINSIALSPDGDYALLHLLNGDSAYVLLRLSDMALARVDMPDELNTMVLDHWKQKEYFEPGIQWHSDGRLTIIGKNGIGMYTLTAE